MTEISQKYFAGIGSRSTPKHILDLMPKITKYLYSKNYILRSGGADGADTFFENGVPEDKEKQIFLPWKNFNKNPSLYYLNSLISKENWDEAKKIASNFHPSYQYLKHGVKKLMTRNTFQVLGPNPLDPSQWSSLVVCYCPLDSDGNLKGGTAQALRIADYKGIKIYNLFVEEDLNKILEKIKNI